VYLKTSFLEELCDSEFAIDPQEASLIAHQHRWAGVASQHSLRGSRYIRVENPGLLPIGFVLFDELQVPGSASAGGIIPREYRWVIRNTHLLSRFTHPRTQPFAGPYHEFKDHRVPRWEADSRTGKDADTGRAGRAQTETRRPTSREGLDSVERQRMLCGSNTVAIVWGLGVLGLVWSSTSLTTTCQTADIV